MIVLDTHTLIRAVEGDGGLGTSASRLIEETVQTDRVAVSAITPREIALLVERRRLRLGRHVGEWIAEALVLPGVALIPIEQPTRRHGLMAPAAPSRARRRT